MDINKFTTRSQEAVQNAQQQAMQQKGQFVLPVHLAYTLLVQEASIVPIVEPEVLMDGDHTIETCHDVSEKSFRSVFEELAIQDIYLEGMVLKPNMVVSGIACFNYTVYFKCFIRISVIK